MNSKNVFLKGDSENSVDLNMYKENTEYFMEENERQSIFERDRIIKVDEKDGKNSFSEVRT